MIVAVSKKDHLPAGDGVYNEFLHAVFRQVVMDQPAHQFVFTGNWDYDQEQPFATNIKLQTTQRQSNHPLLRRWWYVFRLPSLLKKQKASLLIAADGRFSASARLPQCLLLEGPEMAGIQKNVLLQKAKTVITFSEHSRKQLVANTSLTGTNIHTIPAAADKIFHPAGAEEKQEVKEKYTGGREYFICTGSANNLVNLLKAFSSFKRMQQSAMKLVLVTTPGKNAQQELQHLSAYKYREDVVVTGCLTDNEKAKLLGAAYALVNPVVTDNLGRRVLEAAQSDIPVITTSRSPFEGQDAILFADMEDHTDIAAQMMLLYKDETLRNQLIQKGRALALQYDIHKTAARLWDAVTGNTE